MHILPSFLRKKEEAIIVVFGGEENLYERAKILQLFEHHFKTKIQKISNLPEYKCTFFYKDKKYVNIIFTFAFNPRKDEVWEAYERHFKSKGVACGLPASIIVSHIKSNYNPQLILFFGICGAFAGNITTTYLPSSGRELLFNSKFILPEEVGKHLPKRHLGFHNILQGKVEGHNATVISTNMLLQHLGIVDFEDWIKLWRNYISKDNPERKFDFKVAQKWTFEKGKEYSRVLSHFGHIIDKESFTFIRNFRRKKLGIKLQCSDVITQNIPLDTESDMIDWNKFASNVISAIEQCIIHEI